MEKRDQANDELLNFVSPEELETIEQEMNQYLVKYPSDQDVAHTIHTLRQYVPKKTTPTSRLQQKWQYFKTVNKHAVSEISIISKSYWCISIALFLIGYATMIYAEYEPVYTFMFLGPIPFIIGMLEVFKGREKGLWELEMACKFSAQQIMLSRLLIISGHNIILNLLLTVSIMHVLDPGNVLQIVFMWLTPLVLLAAVSLWLSMMIRGAVFVPVFASVWIVFCFAVVAVPSWAKAVIAVHNGVHLLLISIGLVMLWFQLKKLSANAPVFESNAIPR